MVLTSNCLVIAHPCHTTNKYPFSLASNFALKDVALVNVKGSANDNDNVNAENFLQLLIFPEQMYIKCDSARIKRDWLDEIEETKRQQQEKSALHRQATIRGFFFL